MRDTDDRRILRRKRISTATSGSAPERRRMPRVGEAGLARLCLFTLESLAAHTLGLIRQTHVWQGTAHLA